MQLLRKHETSTADAVDKKIRWHLEKSIFYDPSLVQAHYNLALLDYRQNSLQPATRQHLQRVLQLQPSHSKAQLMLCDLALELQNEITDQNLLEAVRCYTKLLGSQDLDERRRNTNLDDLKISKSNDSIASKSLSDTYSQPNERPGSFSGSQIQETNEESKALKSKVMSLAHHNLCSVLDLINRQLMPSNATMNVSAYCSGADPGMPSESLVQELHFQVPTITST